MWKTALCLMGLAVAFPVFAQEQDLRPQVVDYAVQAVTRLRNQLVDPTSFTLLEVKAFTKVDKHGDTKFLGCIRGVAANGFGAKNQAWFGYHFDDKKKEVEVGQELGSYSPTGCISRFYSKDWTSYDVTEEVRKDLKPLEGAK